MDEGRASANPPPGAMPVALAVGEKWPLAPVEDGARVDLLFRRGGLGLDLIVTVGHPRLPADGPTGSGRGAPLDGEGVGSWAAIPVLSALDAARYRQAPILTSIVCSGPIVWLLLDVGGVILEAALPNGTIEGSVAALRGSIRVDDKRLLLAVVAGDVLVEMRVVDIGQHWWWDALGKALEQCPEPTCEEELQAAIDRDRRGWSPREMFDRGAL